jgi:hypothetical protein
MSHRELAIASARLTAGSACRSAARRLDAANRAPRTRSWPNQSKFDEFRRRYGDELAVKVINHYGDEVSAGMRPRVRRPWWTRSLL